MLVYDLEIIITLLYSLVLVHHQPSHKSVVTPQPPMVAYAPTVRLGYGWSRLGSLNGSDFSCGISVSFSLQVLVGLCGSIPCASHLPWASGLVKVCSSLGQNRDSREQASPCKCCWSFGHITIVGPIDQIQSHDQAELFSGEGDSALGHGVVGMIHMSEQ